MVTELQRLQGSKSVYCTRGHSHVRLISSWLWHCTSTDQDSSSELDLEWIRPAIVELQGLQGLDGWRLFYSSPYFPLERRVTKLLCGGKMWSQIAASTLHDVRLYMVLGQLIWINRHQIEWHSWFVSRLFCGNKYWIAAWDVPNIVGNSCWRLPVCPEYICSTSLIDEFPDMGGDGVHKHPALLTGIKEVQTKASMWFSWPVASHNEQIMFKQFKWDA